MNPLVPVYRKYRADGLSAERAARGAGMAHRVCPLWAVPQQIRVRMDGGTPSQVYRSPVQSVTYDLRSVSVSIRSPSLAYPSFGWMGDNPRFTGRVGGHYRNIPNTLETTVPSVVRYRNFDPLTRDEADQLMLPNRRDGVSNMKPGDEWVATYREQVRFHNNPREPIESADLIVGMNDDGTFYAFHSFGS